MKPFGVRLAAGAVTILLGAIMAAQAQKDHQDEQLSSWNPLDKTQQSQSETPAPIALSQWTQGSVEASMETSANPNAEPSPFSDVPGAVQLVQHTQDEMADAASSAVNALAMPSSFGMPQDSATAADSGAAAPMMTFPGDAPSDPGGPAAMSGSFANDPAAGNPDQPSNFLRGAAPADMNAGAGGNAAADSFAAQDAAPNNFMGGFAADAQMTTDAGPSDAAGSPAQMIRSLAMPGDADREAMERGAMERGAMEREQALAAEQQLRDEMAREQEAQQLELDRQRQADAMIARQRQAEQEQAREQQARDQQAREQMALEQQAREQLARQRELQAAPASNAMPQQNQFAGNNAYAGGQPLAPQLPASNFDQRSGNFANPQADLRNTSSRNDFGRGSLQALPAAHRLAGQTNASFAEPGDRRLEGAQAPSVVIHKRAPSEVKVNKPASFVIHVQNVGSADALGVRVHDQVPAGMQFKDATPEPQGGQGGQLVWQLGTLAAGEERTITMELIPVEEGELGSVAHVTFEAAASVRTISTRPEIKIVQTAPKTVLVGQQLEIEVEVSNPGTGDATGVMLQEDVPERLEHPQGRELDNLIGTLRPGEVRRQMLRLRAVAPGIVRNTIFLRADDGLETSHSVDVQVVSPELQVAMVGPGRRFLERQAVYNLDIGNSGTAPATNVRITAFLDRGFTFVSTGKAGQYDPSRHAVYWSLDDLPVGARGQVPLTLLPVQEGARSIRLEANADLGITAKNEHQVDVESLAELTFSVADSADPIEVGTETTYEIKVTNRGSRGDSNVVVKVQLPAGIELVDAENAETDGRGLVVFRPQAELKANSELTYRIKTRGIRDGHHKIVAVVQSDQSRVPVTKEESTMVYDDRQPAVARGQNRPLPGGQRFQ